MVEDPTVRVIAAIVEGFKSGERFVAAAEAAARARKPLVLLKMGRSAYGVAAAQSHTAAIAGEDAINDAVLRQFGVIRVDDLVELHETASLLARASAPPRSICITSLSGGAATYAADILGAEGLSLVQLSSDTRRRLTAIVPDFISVGNPLGLTTAIFSDRELHRSALGVLLQDQEIDAIVMPIPADYGDHTHRVAEDLLAAQTTTQKLLVPVWISERHGSGYAALEKGGLPPFRSMTAAARALRRLADYGSWLQRRGTVEPKSRPPVPVHIAVPDRLDEVSAKSWLASYGVSVPPEQLATTPLEAAAFAERIGRPVALKIVSPDVAHKSDVGGVELGLTGPATVAAAYSRIIERVRRAHPQAQISGVLVSELLTDGIEMLLGFHHDSTFGPVLTIGFGGIFVEVLRDVVHLRLPTSRDEIRVAIDRLRGRRLLDGIRGRPPADLDAVLDAAESFAVFGFAQRGLVVEAEINPLIVRPAGLGAFAADALIHTRRSEISPAVQG
jgi:acyl-CoA synthetase (NDP forming)